MPTSTTTTPKVVDVEQRTALRPIKIKLTGSGPRGNGGGRNGGGGSGNNNGGGNNGGGDDDKLIGFSSARYWVGIYVALAAVFMTFAMLTVLYVARVGISETWHPVGLPRLLWLSTTLILASSAALEIGRKALKRNNERRFRHLLWVTLFLGLGFLVTQLTVFQQLAAQGIYLATNPHSTFFYLLTGTHGLHLLGGILALGYLLLLARHRSTLNATTAQLKQRTISDIVAVYWHFIDGLWVFLFALLFLWK